MTDGVSGGGSTPGATGRRRASLVWRFTLAHAALACATIAGALGFLYWSALEAQRRAIDDAIALEAQVLRDQLVGRTTSQMAAVIRRHASGAPSLHTIIVFQSEQRQVVAGNMRSWPIGEAPRDRALEFGLPLPGVPDVQAGVARGRLIELPSGQRLLVGRNVTDLVEMRERILRAFIGAIALTAALGLGAGYAFSRSVSRRLGAINRSSEAILAGDLSRRIPAVGGGDEFDELAANLNRMLDRLDGLMRGMREVADDIAHDMRSPISRLRSRIEVTLMGPPDAATYRDVLEQTVKDADDVLAMFNALLTIALAESGAPRDRFTDVDAAAIARDTAEIYEPLAEDHGIALAVDAPSPARLRGEPHLLSQALANLLDNAVKYVPRGGRVRVSVVRAGGRVRIAVEDDGPGIPESFRDKAFDRFTRLEASRSAAGSGLGLSLVRAVARLHGGSVALAGADPGLRVELDLPVGDGRSGARAAAD
jgi:signal transduction histidine kinase